MSNRCTHLRPKGDSGPGPPAPRHPARTTAPSELPPNRFLRIAPPPNRRAAQPDTDSEYGWHRPARPEPGGRTMSHRTTGRKGRMPPRQKPQSPEAPAHGGRFTRIFGRFAPPDKIPATPGIGPTATPRHDFCPAAAGRMRTGMGPCVRADLEIRRKVTILQPNRRRPDAFPMTETEYEPKKRIAYRKIFYSLNQRRKRV